MTTKDYFKLTEDAGSYYRNKNFVESIGCCFKIAQEIDSIKKQIVDFKELNKDFIWYTVLNLFSLSDNEIAKKTLEIILNSDIVNPSKFKNELYEYISLAISDCSTTAKYENIKGCLKYFKILNLYNKEQEEEFQKKLENSFLELQEYHRINNLISNNILELVKNAELSQKELFKKITEFDGRKILPVLKSLEKEKKITREKRGNDYYISIIRNI